jgi:hypothetical protein
LKVLAKGAAERAAGEEHGSGPISACERGFLAEVRAHIRNPELTVLPAEPGPRLFALLKPVHAAFPGTEKTLFEEFGQASFHKRILTQRKVAANKSEALNPKSETNSNDQNLNDIKNFKSKTGNFTNEFSRN